MKFGVYNFIIINILLLQVMDRDFGGNGEIKYFVEEGNIGNVFKIDEMRYLVNLLSK